MTLEYSRGLIPLSICFQILSYSFAGSRRSTLVSKSAVDYDGSRIYVVYRVGKGLSVDSRERFLFEWDLLRINVLGKKPSTYDALSSGSFVPIKPEHH
jgi:hypothetical protein